MKKKGDIRNWARKEHYEFFKQFDEPFYGLATNIDVAKAYYHAKENNISFFIYYLYLTLKAVHGIKEFRYRIENEELFCYDTINASATVDRGNGTFGFSNIQYDKNLEKFIELANKEIERVRKLDKIEFFEENNFIHVTTIPWFSFTSLTHPRHYKFKESIPKISYGKYFKENNKLLMPVSVFAHHAIVDGYHVGRFYELFQQLLNEKQ